MSAHSETDDPNGEGDGVWSPDIEEAFERALREYPPCGRRKTILPGEGAGKMYGRNELIAKYIFIHTGKHRTRKQVSSHIQVLARRKLRTDAGSRGTETDSISPASSINNSSIGIGRTSRPESAMSGIQYKVEMQNGNGTTTTTHHHQTIFYDIWADRPIVTQKIRLVEFSAFLESRLASPRLATNGNVSSQASLNHALAASLSTAASAATTNTTGATNNNNSNHNFGSPLANGNHLHPQSLDHHNQFRPNHNSFASAAIQASHPLVPSHNQHHNHQHLSSGPFSNQQAAYQHLNGHHNVHLNGHEQPMAASPQSDMLLMTATQNGHHNHNHHHHNHHQQHHSYPFNHQTTDYLRHSYIKIDYRQPFGAHESKLEEIAIEQIQDKFPEIGDPDGLFQRGPADAFFLVKFWADIDSDQKFNHFEDQNSFFSISSHFETIESYTDITCSTKACSYGDQVVEKVEKMYGTYNRSNGRYSYSNVNGIDKPPTCEFMTQFIKKLRQLPSTSLMNSVLENFTVLQVVTSESTSEILLCLAYVFEIAAPGQNNGSQYHVYKLSKGSTAVDVKAQQQPTLHQNLHTIAMTT